MTEQSDKEMILSFLTTMSNEIKARIPKATGRTANSVGIVMIADTIGQIQAAPWIGALEMGRKPTGNGASTSGKTLRESILEWIKAKGIQPSDAKTSQESLAFLIARSIHRSGTLLYRAGGYSGLLSDSFSEGRLTEIAKAFSGKYQVIISSQVFNYFSTDKKFIL